MTDLTRDREIVQTFYKNMHRGDMAAFLAAIDEDITWINKLSLPIPFGGVFEGKEATLGYFARLNEAIRMETFEIESVIAAEDGIFVTGNETSLVRATGNRYTMEWIHMVRVRDGKVVYLREFNDSATMMAAF